MITIENTETYGWEAAIRGMRNPMNSWDKSDSYFGDSYLEDEDTYIKSHIGPKDLDLMKRLVKAGTDHRKFMRMIAVYCDITAPLYWWKEFKTYRSGRKFGDDEPTIIDIIVDGYLEYDIEMNSCSTMHKIHSKKFEIDDFSHEHLDIRTRKMLEDIVSTLNDYRNLYINYDPDDFEIKGCPSKKDIWWQMIQLLPSSYNQKRTIMLNYEVLANMYKSRKSHKLDEWRVFCDWIEKLPYSELIIGEE